MNTNILAPNDTEIKSDKLDEYGRRALATRSRCTYATPAQKAAFAKYLSLAHMRREIILTRNEWAELATHPDLLPRQRAQFAAMAQGE